MTTQTLASMELIVTDHAGIWAQFLNLHYRSALAELSRLYPHEKSLVIDYTLLEAFGSEGKTLADALLARPEQTFADVKDAIRQKHLMNCRDEDGRDNLLEVVQDINIRFIRLPRRTQIRDIRASQIGRFITVKGIVRRMTGVSPRLIVGAFRCPSGHITHVAQIYGDMAKPDVCSNGECKHTRLVLVPEKSIFIDSQRVRIQESPEGLLGGDQPQSLDLDVLDDICGMVAPGNEIVVNGILRSIQKKNTTSFTQYIDVNSIEVSVKGYEEIIISSEDEERIHQFAEDPDVYTKILRSIAPTIYGHDSVKAAIALQLFGGVTKDMTDGTRIRGDIHILLVGDPGIAKSQLLRYVVRLAPRGVYTAGKSASAAGLTATAVKDDLNGGGWTLDAGALVLADRGIAAVDELDKMSDEDRGSLHEAMEQQTISVAKAGINATLQTRCALLAAANPREGRFDPTLEIGGQINMPPSLLSRFDLIYVLRACYDADFIDKIASHVNDVHCVGEAIMRHEDIDLEMVQPEIDAVLLRKYIAYAKKCIPKMSDEAKRIIAGYYKKLCSFATDLSKPVPATTRQQEATIRLAEASARIRLSDAVTAEDAKRAVKIVDACLQEVAYDPTTGQIDIDRLAGTGKATRDERRECLDVIKMVRGNAPSADAVKVLQILEKEGIDGKKVLEKLKKDGDVLVMGRFVRPLV